MEVDGPWGEDPPTSACTRGGVRRRRCQRSLLGGGMLRSARTSGCRCCRRSRTSRRP